MLTAGEGDARARAMDNPRPRSLVLSLVLRAALAVAVDPIAAATGLPSPVVAQLGAVALDAAAALVSREASDDAPPGRARKGNRRGRRRR